MGGLADQAKQGRGAGVQAQRGQKSSGCLPAQRQGDRQQHGQAAYGAAGKGGCYLGEALGEEALRAADALATKATYEKSWLHTLARTGGIVERAPVDAVDARTRRFGRSGSGW